MAKKKTRSHAKYRAVKSADIIIPSAIVFGLVVKRFRLRANIPQNKLCTIAGTSSNAVSKIEMGAVSTQLSTLLGIARALDVPASEMVRAYEETQAAVDKIVTEMADATMIKRIKELSLLPPLSLRDEIAADQLVELTINAALSVAELALVKKLY